MEDPRCRITANVSEDPRCKNLLSGVTVDVDDPRCNHGLYCLVVHREKFWYGKEALQMEDPRCRNWRVIGKGRDEI